VWSWLMGNPKYFEPEECIDVRFIAHQVICIDFRHGTMITFLYEIFYTLQQCYHSAHCTANMEDIIIVTGRHDSMSKYLLRVDHKLTAHDACHFLASNSLHEVRRHASSVRNWLRSIVHWSVMRLRLNDACCVRMPVSEADMRLLFVLKMHQIIGRVVIGALNTVE
jgi:hypothetical protein